MLMGPNFDKTAVAACTATAAVTQRSKLTFSKSCLLATFNCKMVGIKKNFGREKKEKKTYIQARKLRVCYMNV